MMGAQEVIFAATMGGAQAIGLDAQVGSLKEGAEADLAIINLSGPHQQPVYEPYSSLVFNSSALDVQLTVVAGREIFREGRMLTVDEPRLGARMKELQEKLSAASDALSKIKSFPKV